MEYQRAAQRFYVKGLSLTPQDSLGPGLVGYARNVRSYTYGTVEPRYGLSVVNSVTLGNPIHSIFRLNDTTSFASASAARFLGASGSLYSDNAFANPEVFASIDTGYSGDPLSAVALAPAQSPQPWLYVSDRSRQRKVTTGGTVAPIGITQPMTEPTVTVAELNFTLLDGNATLASWGVEGAIATAPAAATRVNTTADAIIYDSGATGWACVIPADFSNIIAGTRLSLDASSEEVTVAEIHPAVTDTTIAAIIYDAGTTGYCTIQPTTSLAVGQLEAPNFDELEQRYYKAAPTPASRTAQTTRAVDFPVNSVVRLNGTDLVRVLSVAMGTDGILSFRCYTNGTFAAGQAIAGVASFRTYARLNHPYAGAQLLSLVNQQTLTPATTAAVVSGMKNLTVTIDAAVVGEAALGFTPRATQPDDDIVLSIKATDLSFVSEIRFYLNVDAANQSFLSNYYFHAWRANDLIKAIQATNAGSVSTVQTAKGIATSQTYVDDPTLGGTYVPPEYDGDGNLVPGTGISYATHPNPATPSGSDAIGLTSTSRQLALGNNQWLALRCKVRDLIRVGQDTTRTLKNINAVELLVRMEGSVTPTTIQYADFYLSGGFGPDVRETAEPYVYAYRRRSSTTGAKSNPSPPNRGGVSPRRQRVMLQAPASIETTVDRDDWFRRGGLLAGWAYVGTVPTGTVLNDDATDSAIDGNENLRQDLYQPWPIADQARSGVCSVAGTAISRTSGDTFNTGWAPGTVILVNGRAATLYASPASTAILQLNENCGSGTGISWSIPEPTILAQPLPATWGGEINGVIFRFACGDAADPGACHWSNGNDPDAGSDANWLSVTSASEPLQNGGIYNNRPFVFSSDQLYVLEPSFGLSLAASFSGIQANTFRALRTPCNKGLKVGRWAFCVAPEGIYFRAEDGIYLTAGGSPAVCLTNPDLSPIFPRDGVVGETTRGIVPPNDAQATRHRLSYVDGVVYYDYLGTDGNDYTLLYNTRTQGWLFDQYQASGVRTRLSEPGRGVESQILGAENGNLYAYSATALLDGTTAINWDLWTPQFDGGDPRIIKQFGDVILDCQPGSSTNGFTITPVTDNGTTVLASVTGAVGTIRTQFVVDINAGAGVLSTNLGLRIAGASSATDLHRPLMYLWEPSFLPKADQAQRRATDWVNAGVNGAKQVRGVIIRANTYGSAKAIQIQYDGGTVAQTISLNSNGETEVAFALTPFYATLLRLAPTTTTPWFCLTADVQWIVDPKPEYIAVYTDWDDAGTPQDKYIMGLVLEVDTQGVAGVQVQVQTDNSVVASTITLTATTREDGQAFSFNPPLYAHVMRLVPLAAVRIKSWKWIAVPKPELIAAYSDWTDDGNQGSKFFQGIVLHVDTGGVSATVNIESDNGVVQQTITIPATTGEDGYPLSFTAPFVAYRVRLAPTSPVRVLGVKWVWEPTPELATRWETQYTTHDLPGFLSVYDGVIAYNSTTTVTWQIQYQDGTSLSYTLASSAGAYKRVRQIAAAAKGKAVRYIWTAASPFQLFKRDCSVRVGPWGLGVPYVQTVPFGGIHRADGAAI